MACVIGRPIGGISLNGVEYLLDENQEPKLFDSESQARDFLKGHGCTEEEMESFLFMEEE